MITKLNCASKGGLSTSLDIGSSFLTAINIYVDDDVFVIKTTEDSHQYLLSGCRKC